MNLDEAENDFRMEMRPDVQCMLHTIFMQGFGAGSLFSQPVFFKNLQQRFLLDTKTTNIH